MKTNRWIVGLCGLALSGCSQIACKQEASLGIDEQEALRRIPGMRLIAEEFNRREYSCELYEDCPSTSWFRSSNPYKLSFENARLLRIEINQDELTRRELNRAVEMRFNHYRW